MSYRLALVLYDERSGVKGDWTLLPEMDDVDTQIVLESAITREVAAALWRKQIAGAVEHNRTMQPGDGVDAIQNAFEEALDLSQYLMKMIEERSHD